MIRRTRSVGDEGLTAVELVVVSFVLVVMSGLVFATFRHDLQAFSRQTSQVGAQMTLRIWVARMEERLRGVCFNPAGTSPNPYTITTATNTTFQATANSTPSNIGYRLNTSSNSLESWQGGSAWRPVLSNVTSFDFNYHDAQGLELDPTSSDFSVTSIDEIEVTLVAKPPSTGIPGAPTPVISQHFRASLRNPCI